MSAPPSVPSTPAARVAHSGPERWLSSPVRRTLLMLGGALLLATLSAALWMDAAESFGRPADWTWIVERRLIEWLPWVLMFEPLIWFARRLNRWTRSGAVAVLLHVPLSFGVALGMTELDAVLADAMMPDPPWAEERGEPRPGPSAPDQGSERRGPRPRSARSMWGRFRTERGILVYWALLGVGWSLHSYLRNREQERRAVDLELRSATLERELARAQLGNLQSRLHPHFLFNALHSVGGLVRNGEEQAALSTLSNVGGLLRAMLELGDRTEVALGAELELVERYLDVERIRLGERLRVETSFEPGAAGAMVPTLILLPLVENTIKHGIAPRREGGVVSLSARRVGDQVELVVSDDGPGFPPAVLAGDQPESERAHIGLANTRERLAAHYGGAAALELDNPPGGGARAVLRLPFRSAT